MGHIRSYTIVDAYARFRRAKGDSLLLSIGFDAFGLPAEMSAIEHGIPVDAWVDNCRERIRSQLDQMGFSFNWERSFVSSDEDMYRWSQWLFLTLLERGLIYRAAGQVDWCEACETVLANLQVDDGRCWRCDGPVRVDERAQWYLRTTAYVEENDRRIDEQPSADRMWRASQQTIIGRLEGHELIADGSRGRLAIFVPGGASTDGAGFVAISPRYPDVDAWVVAESAREALRTIRAGGWRRSTRRAEDAPVIDSGCAVRLLDRSAVLPVVITPAVDARYGPIAVLGEPGANRTDTLIAQGIPSSTTREIVATADPRSMNQTVHYRARDYPISRQRAWGAPIPIIHCTACGAVPVPAATLPVRLPRDIQPTGRGNTLLERSDFLMTTCPSCGGSATRESDTLDCHFDASWMFVPVCVPAHARAEHMFDHPELQRWLPGHRIVWGADGGPSILDQRFVAKALRDAGTLPWLLDGEPFSNAFMHEMVQLDGRKMSKHLGNVVDPETLTARVGADAMRLATLIAAAPQHRLKWTESAVPRSVTFLGDLWSFAHARLTARPQPPAAATINEEDALRRRLARWSRAALHRITEDFEVLDMHRAGENAMQFLSSIRTFEARVRERRGTPDELDREAVVVALRLLLRLLAPITPHIADELWDLGECEGLAVQQPWPTIAGERPSSPRRSDVNAVITAT